MQGLFCFGRAYGRDGTVGWGRSATRTVRGRAFYLVEILMALLQRLALSGAATLFAAVLSSHPVVAATARPTTPPKPIAIPQPARASVAPLIIQVNPAKVNPTMQPNIMILGQHLTPASTVQVGGRPATTVEAPDQNHLLVKLPDNLSQGTYVIEVRNEAGTAVASDPLVVDGSVGQQPMTMKYIAIGGFLALLVLVMRMARMPGFRAA